MRNIELFILGLLISTSTYGQFNISGIVISKEDKLPIPGVSVYLKGTKIGTVTKMDGSFEITTKPDSSVLVFSFIGLVPKELKIQNSGFIEVQLKDDCIVDFFYHKYLGVGYFGGLNNSKIGGFIDIFYPYLIRPAIQLQLGYQTDSKNNEQTFGELGLNEILVNCDYNLDFAFTYNSIILKNEPFNFKSYKIWSKIDKNKYSLIGGLGQSERLILGKSEKQFGYEVGLSKWLAHWLQISTRATYWTNFWQFQAALQYDYKRIHTSLTFNRIDNYSEFNLKTVFEILR